MEQKIAKSGKAAYFCVRLCQILLSVTFLLFLAGIVWCAVMYLNPRSQASLSLPPGVVFNSPVSLFTGMGSMLGNVHSDQLASLPPAILLSVLLGQETGVVLLLLIFGTIGAVFKSVSRDCLPFSRENSLRLKKVSVLILFLALAPSLVQIFFQLCLSGGLGSGLSADIDLTVLIFGILFFALANIFEYGSALQRQADETL